MVKIWKDFLTGRKVKHGKKLSRDVKVSWRVFSLDKYLWRIAQTWLLMLWCWDESEQPLVVPEVLFRSCLWVCLLCGISATRFCLFWLTEIILHSGSRLDTDLQFRSWILLAATCCLVIYVYEASCFVFTSVYTLEDLNSSSSTS